MYKKFNHMYAKYVVATYLYVHWFCMYVYIQDKKN